MKRVIAEENLKYPNATQRPIHRRNSLRLPHYDYSSPGVYFVTVCARAKQCLFGDVMDGAVHLNGCGRIVAGTWDWLFHQYDYVTLDASVIMPNHLHGILIIDANCRGGSRTAPTNTRKPLGRLIGAFKTVSTKRINEMRNTPGAQIWQRNYYEHIIRDEETLEKIREYIASNPAKWEFDHENPAVVVRQSKGRTEIDEILENRPKRGASRNDSPI